MELWHLRKIPKQIFFYWGAPKISWMRVLSIVSFAAFNPDWKVIVMVPAQLTRRRSWRSKEYRNIYAGPDFSWLLEAAAEKYNIEIQPIDMMSQGIPNEISEVHKSDFLRLLKLGETGGLYSDSDILFFRSVTNLRINTPKAADTTNVFCTNGRARVHYIGFLGASGENRLFQNLAEKAKAILLSSYKNLGYQAIGSTLFQSLHDWPKVKSLYPEMVAQNLDTKEVYSYDHRGFKALYHKGLIEPATWDFGVGIHWFGGHPSSASIENTLRPDRIDKSQIRMAHLCRYIWENSGLSDLATQTKESLGN